MATESLLHFAPNPGLRLGARVRSLGAGVLRWRKAALPADELAPDERVSRDFNALCLRILGEPLEQPKHGPFTEQYRVGVAEGFAVLALRTETGPVIATDSEAVRTVFAPRGEEMAGVMCYPLGARVPNLAVCVTEGAGFVEPPQITELTASLDRVTWGGVRQVTGNTRHIDPYDPKLSLVAYL